jgi:hypothetical protein
MYLYLPLQDPQKFTQSVIFGLKSGNPAPHSKLRKEFQSKKCFKSKPEHFGFKKQETDFKLFLKRIELPIRPFAEFTDLRTIFSARNNSSFCL